jgi:peptidoglycan hydrolase-like protein with peptidoglycan-binding domain
MPKIKQKPKMSKVALIVATLLVVVAGVYLVYKSFAATCVVGNSAYCPTVRQGSSGSAVRVLQTELNTSEVGCALGHLKVDGAFGPATLKAVKKFQSDWRLSVDGIVGPKTWYQLNAVYNRYHNTDLDCS